MAKFSERYGYTQPSTVLIRETLTKDVQNAICNAYDSLRSDDLDVYMGLEKHLWQYFLNRRLNDFKVSRYESLPLTSRKKIIQGTVVATEYILDDDNLWHKKLDLIENTALYLKNLKEKIQAQVPEHCLTQQDDFGAEYADPHRFEVVGFVRKYAQFYDSFIEKLNSEFERFNFAYRIVKNQIVEITSKEEIAEIESALENPSKGVKKHLQTAMKSLSQRPDGDYRNSIKESISAVEAIIREITGESTLNLAKLEKSGIVLPEVLKNSFNILYGYTNSETTGIRHALMEDTNTPTADEAVFMLVACSAFINYLTKRRVKIQK